MQGLLTIGSAAGSAELEVAAALCGADSSAAAFVASAVGRAPLGPLADASGTPVEELAERSFEVEAPPAIAARHAGSELLPGPLLEAARAMGDGGEVLVVATSGGLLGALAERYSNRDFALELGFPVVLAVAAGPDMAAPALLALEGATGAGLAVPAIVISGWPETPGRVLLDERKLLERQAPVPVVLAGDSLPVREWAAATPAAPTAPDEGAPPPPRITLEPYAAWEPHPVGDPRATPRASIMEMMLEIVGAEGPMTASRAYALYNRASGGRKLTSVARAPLSSAIYWLARENKLTLTREADIPWQGGDMVRLPDQPAVRVRELGSRTLDEVPLDEIAELVKLIRSEHGTSNPTDLKRAILTTYGLVRLTSRADEYLGLAIDLAS